MEHRILSLNGVQPPWFNPTDRPITSSLPPGFRLSSPSLSRHLRYPCPDPSDPFASLSELRLRMSQPTLVSPAPTTPSPISPMQEAHIIFPSIEQPPIHLAPHPLAQSVVSEEPEPSQPKRAWYQKRVGLWKRSKTSSPEKERPSLKRAASHSNIRKTSDTSELGVIHGAAAGSGPDHTYTSRLAEWSLNGRSRRKVRSTSETNLSKESTTPPAPAPSTSRNTSLNSSPNSNSMTLVDDLSALSHSDDHSDKPTNSILLTSPNCKRKTVLHTPSTIQIVPVIPGREETPSNALRLSELSTTPSRPKGRSRRPSTAPASSSSMSSNLCQKKISAREEFRSPGLHLFLGDIPPHHSRASRSEKHDQGSRELEFRDHFLNPSGQSAALLSGPDISGLKGKDGSSNAITPQPIVRRRSGGRGSSSNIPFTTANLPSSTMLQEASSLELFDESGRSLRFGQLFQDKIVVAVFIRHFWCPMCHDYMRSIVQDIDPSMLQAANVQLVIIGCGDPAMLKYYKSIFHSPFPLYTDPTLELYEALGMTRKTTLMGPDAEKGSYIQGGVTHSSIKAIRSNLKSMPLNVVLKNGGDFGQLGGEFVLGPGIKCRYAHRMHNTRSHAPIKEVVSQAGVDFNPSPPESRIHFMIEEENRWMQQRELDLRNLRHLRAMRRYSHLLDNESSSDVHVGCQATVCQSVIVGS